MKFIKIITFLILLVAVYGLSSHNTESFGSRIVNGKTAGKGAFPYTVILRQPHNDYYCAGAILNERWILTAAHCIYGSIFINIGSNKISERGVLYPIEIAYIHPDYKNYPNGANDIALIKLDRNIEFNDYVKPIPLPSSEVKDKQEAVVAGWGHTKSGGSLSDDLQYINVTLLTTATCQKEFDSKLHKSVICAKGERNQGVCNQDGGSPLVANGAIVGITKRYVSLFPCANEFPDVYTDVHQFLDWINEKINKN